MSFTTNGSSKLLIAMHNLTFSTANIVDSGPVNELQASSPNNSTLVITWRSPSSPNGDILSYSIVITNLVSGAIVRLMSVVGNENRYTASGLGTRLYSSS